MTILGQHLCHANSCKVPVPPRLFMCVDHWYMLPKAMRDAVLASYRPGQEITKDPSMEYLEHAMACIEYLAQKGNS